MAIISPFKKIFNWQTATEKIPYKVYTALLTQTGTDAPTAKVLKNTIGSNASYRYDAPGQYAIIFTKNIFTYDGTGGGTNFTVIQSCSNAGPQLLGPGVVWAYYSAPNEIRFEIYDLTTGNTGDDFMQDLYLEIRVYN